MRGFCMLLLATMISVTGCSSGSSSSGTTGTGGTTTATTEMAGVWSTSGTGTCTTGCSSVSATFQTTLVTSTCSVNTPLGVFTVAGNMCYIANNNSGAGSITGSLISSPSKNFGQGVLVGVSADPVPDNSTVNLVFVTAAGGGKFREFTGTATVVGGKMAGNGTCNAASTASCSGASATFTATHQ